MNKTKIVLIFFLALAILVGAVTLFLAWKLGWHCCPNANAGVIFPLDKFPTSAYCCGALIGL
jgi:hypothetical protein